MCAWAYVPGEFALSVCASPGMSVFLQWPDIRQPESDRALHDVPLGTRRFTLPAIITLPIEACIIPYRQTHSDGTVSWYLSIQFNHITENNTQSYLMFISLIILKHAWVNTFYGWRQHCICTGTYTDHSLSWAAGVGGIRAVTECTYVCPQVWWVNAFRHTGWTND